MENRFYVYEWCIVETGEVFYVGKGTGNRALSSKSRDVLFEKIRKLYKTSYRLVYDNLTEEQALKLEARQMLVRKLEGNHLVNILDEFDDYYFPDLDDAYMEFCEREAIRFDEEDTRNNNMRKRNFNPKVYVDDLSVHYFGMPEDAKFDIIEDEFLEVYLHQRTTALRNSRIQEEVEYIKSFFTKVKVRTKKKAKYIVEFEIPSYNEVIAYRDEGYKVIHAIDLIRHLNNGRPLDYKSNM